jgi:CheY-like chemotaxis protein
VKFTPTGGQVTLRLGPAAGDLVIEVIDSGIGIRAEDQDRIFEAFTQVDGSLARQYQGTGLGLTLVRRFAEMHGGRVSVFSRPGEGSRFTVILPGLRSSEEPAEEERAAPPAAAPPPLAPAETPADAARSAPAETDLIYVIEDNPSNLRLVSDLLASRGYQVASSASGEEGLQALKFSTPHLILIDIQLPGMDGLQVARLVRASPGMRDVPILALTAHAMKGDEERAREAGCDGYMTKPINTTEFLGEVARLIGTGRARPAAGGARG